jgi:hypothetical protein
MIDSTTRHTWMTRPAPLAHLGVLDLLGQARPQSHLAVESII